MGRRPGAELGTLGRSGLAPARVPGELGAAPVSLLSASSVKNIKSSGLLRALQPYSRPPVSKHLPVTGKFHTSAYELLSPLSLGSTPQPRAKLRNTQHPHFERAQTQGRKHKRWLCSVSPQRPHPQAPPPAIPAKTSKSRPAKFPATAYLTSNSRRRTTSSQWGAGTRRSTSTRLTAMARKESGCSNARVMFWVSDGQRYV